MRPVHEYVDMAPSYPESSENQNKQFVFPPRGRTSTFPGAPGGSFLSPERLSTPSIFSFREQKSTSCNVGSESLMNLQTLGNEFAEEDLQDKNISNVRGTVSANQCKCTRSKAANEIHWNRRRIPQVQPGLSKKSSSRLHILFSAALFLLAFVTGNFYFLSISTSICMLCTLHSQLWLIHVCVILNTWSSLPEWAND